MGTEREFDAIASDAIASSEKEFFAEAMGDAEADGGTEGQGDRSLEEIGSGLEGQQEAEDGNGDGEGDGSDPEAKAAEDLNANLERDENGRFKPKGEQPARSETPAERGLRTELTSEREKRRSAESDFANYRAEMDKRFAALEAQLKVAQPQQTQPAKEPPKEEIPDRWTDPEGYDRWHREQILNEVRSITQQQEQRRVAGSFEEARVKHGADFDEAYKLANALPADDPSARQLLETIMQSPNPGERLIQWHRSQQAAREIGNDPAAFRAKVQAEAREALMKDPEFRKQLLADMRGEAVRGDGAVRTTTQLPPSLNGARGGGLNRPGVTGGSDAELFNEIMG